MSQNADTIRQWSDAFNGFMRGELPAKPMRNDLIRRSSCSGGTGKRTLTSRSIFAGSRYVFSYRVNGRQKWESARTLEDARKAKAARHTDIGRGEFSERSRITLHEYGREWVERYQGRGRRGFREHTRTEYRSALTAPRWSTSRRARG